MNHIIGLGVDGEEYSYNGDREYEFILTDGNFALGVSHRRGKEDKHFMFSILMEDDTNLFEAKWGPPTWSTFWLKPMEKFLGECDEYLKTNFNLDDSWGYKNS